MSTLTTIDVQNYTCALSEILIRPRVHSPPPLPNSLTTPSKNTGKSEPIIQNYAQCTCMCPNILKLSMCDGAGLMIIGHCLQAADILPAIDSVPEASLGVSV